MAKTKRQQPWEPFAAEEMTDKTALEINSACVKYAFHRTLGLGEPCGLPDYSLPAMLVAKRLVERMNELRQEAAKLTRSGYELLTVCDDRLLAEMYAEQNYGPLRYGCGIEH